MIHSPVLIIGCPRSGTTLLYNILSEIPIFWSLGHESKSIIEHFHHPSTKNWVSGALDASDITPTSRNYMLAEFERQAAPGTFWQRVNHIRASLRDNPGWLSIKHRSHTKKAGSGASSAIFQQGVNAIRLIVRWRNVIIPQPAEGVQLLEKTPENCLRLPFLLELFPDARVIYLVRDGRSNINSLIEGWRQPYTFPGYQVPSEVNIPGDTRGRWAFTLIPGWQSLCDRPLEEVCAWQWVRCNQAVLDFLDQTQGSVPHLMVRYEDLIYTPGKLLSILGEFLEVPYEGVIANYAESLPQINTVSTPDPEKWRWENGDSIERVLPIMKPLLELLDYPAKISS